MNSDFELPSESTRKESHTIFGTHNTSAINNDASRPECTLQTCSCIYCIAGDLNSFVWNIPTQSHNAMFISDYRNALIPLSRHKCSIVMRNGIYITTIEECSTKTKKKATRNIHIIKNRTATVKRVLLVYEIQRFLCVFLVNCFGGIT